MEAPRVRLGELLVRAGLISRQQLDETLVLQQRDRRRLGTLLVESGLVSEAQVTQILSQQLSVPWVSLQHIDFSEQLLRLVPRGVVERYCLVPIYVRRVRGLGDALYVAMDDPTHAEALAEVERLAGLHVRAMIAPPEAIRTAIRDNYGLEIPPDFGSGIGHGVPIREPQDAQPTAPLDSFDDDADTGVHWRRKLMGSNRLGPPGGAPTREGPDSDVDELLDSTAAVEVDALLASIPPDPGKLRAYELRSIDEGLVSETTGQLSADDPDVIEIPPASIPRASAAVPATSASPRPGSDREAPRAASPQASSAAPRGPAPASRPPVAGTRPAASATASAMRPSSRPPVPRRGPSRPPAASAVPLASPRSEPPARAASPGSAASAPASGEAPRPPPWASSPPLPPPPSTNSRPLESRPEARSRVPRSVTLLDGTTLSLPGAAGEAGSAGEPSDTTVRDLVAALRAAARGVDAREGSRDPQQWQRMFAALLAILVRKGLLTDREFLDELEKG
jgi:type IV pilus assembly protein PilB